MVLEIDMSQNPKYWANKMKDDYILAQYTGVKDKNGKEIFENDICKVIMPSGRGYIGQVDYRNGGFWIVKHNGYGGVGWNISDIYDNTKIAKGTIEVIGNIYQNEELLK